MSIDVSKLEIDSREYLSIFRELQAAVPNLTDLWTCSDENDPGVVLVKLISMYGDMLSYNLDRATLELYESSVTQRYNAQKIFELIGYKMHWYKSAKCTAHLSNISGTDLILPKLTQFIALDNETEYVYWGNNNSGNVTIPAYGSIDVELVQGILNAPQRLTKDIAGANSKWHTIYDYNVYKEDIINDNYIYINNKIIDQDHIYLIDNLGYTWTLVESIDMLEATGRYFEFNIDNKDEPYIRLVKYWEDFNVNSFKLFTLTTRGKDGNIYVNALKETAISRIIRYNGVDQVDSTRNVVVTNDPSTIGYDYELPQEARETAKNYINTFDTLVTIADFTRATKRIEGVSNCMVTDYTCDPGYITLNNNDVMIYITRSDDYAEMSEEVYSSYIISELNKNKLIPLNIEVDLDHIKYFTWHISGIVNLTEKVTVDTAQSILVDINNMLKFNYDYSKIDYNSVVTYYDVISKMKEANDYISSVDLNEIEYYDDENHKVDKLDITGQYQIKPDFTSGSEIEFTLDNVPIKPKSVVIRINGSQHVLYDDGNGEFVSSSGIFESGTIDIETGEVDLKFIQTVTNGSVTVSYTKNMINIIKFAGVDVNTLVIPQTYIRE